MLMNFAGSVQTLIIAGVGAFSFKFLTEQYNLDFDTSGNLIGKNSNQYYICILRTLSYSNFFLLNGECEFKSIGIPLFLQAV